MYVTTAVLIDACDEWWLIDVTQFWSCCFKLCTYMYCNESVASYLIFTGWCYIENIRDVDLIWSRIAHIILLVFTWRLIPLIAYNLLQDFIYLCTIIHQNRSNGLRAITKSNLNYSFITEIRIRMDRWIIISILTLNRQIILTIQFQNLFLTVRMKGGNVAKHFVENNHNIHF